MAKEKLADLSLEHLTKRKKSLLTVTYVVIGLFAMIAIATVYYMSTGEWDTSKLPLVSSLALMLVLFSINYSMTSKIKEEIKKREEASSQ